MLGKAHQRFQEGNQVKPTSSQALAKELFPSSSPSTDIREQLSKKPSTAATVSARAISTYQNVNPLSSKSSNANTARHQPGQSSLAVVCGSADSFKNQPSVIDLTDGPNKVQEPVFFGEDDFSDDDALDLDFEAPCALPPLPANAKPAATSNISFNENLTPVPSSIKSETQIPWSSSPLSHFQPPTARTASTTSTSTLNFSKRRSPTEEEEKLNADSVPRKAKRRVLPASFQQDPQDHGEDVTYGSTLKTPSSKRKDFWDPSASAVKEQKKQLKNQRNPKAAPDADDDYSMAEIQQVIKSQAKNYAITLSEEQKQVVDLVVNKSQSCFFTGPAGTGKSVLMRTIISDLKKKYAKDPERVAVTASTGLAACNIGGITLHSFSGIGLGKEDAPTLVKKIRRNPKAKNRWLRTKCLIIDEISMVDGELFDKLSQIGRTIRNNGRPWGGIQLIITGDFFQLPPVPDSGAKQQTKFAFDAATWNTSIDHTIGLTQVFRQRDPQFAQMLNEMRLGRITDDTVRAFKALTRPLEFSDGLGMTELFSTRSEVEGSNERRLRELPGKLQRYDATDTGDPNIRDKLLSNMMAPKTIDLKLDAQVMLIKNLDDTLVNGSLGRVIAFSDEKTFEMNDIDDLHEDEALTKAKRKLMGFSNTSEVSGGKFPVVQFNSTDGTSRTILCQPEEWKVELPNGEVQAKRTQLPLILAWALSIHKAQGQTLERVKVNLGRVFEKGQAYVALSRATTQQGLQVLGFDKGKVMAHPRVVNFYNQLYSVEEAKKRRPVPISTMLTSKTAAPAPKTQQVVTIDDDEEEAMASYNY